MFDDYGWCTKAKIEISTADDSSKTHTTHVDVYSTYQLNYASIRTNTER